MTVINRREKWLFLCEPRTASRGTTKALLQLKGSEQIGHHHDNLMQLVNDGTISNLDLIDYSVICTVRNPFDTLVTTWCKSESKESFASWVGNPTSALNIIPSLLKGLWHYTNKVCYYENLQEDLDTVFDQHVPLQYNDDHRTPNKRHWSTYYSKQHFDCVMVYYRSFMINYGYSIVDGETYIDPEVHKRHLQG